MSGKKGFTLIELLIVLAIMGILASIVITAVSKSKEKAYYTRAIMETRSMSAAIEMYQNDHNGNYPPDASRDIAPGIEKYLAGDQNARWPSAPWPGSVYDWDNWQDPDNPFERIYQISIRFCPVGGTIDQCHFPNEDWAQNFEVNSAVYYCISGSCRSHIAEPVSYPGYCVNCGNK